MFLVPPTHYALRRDAGRGQLPYPCSQQNSAPLHCAGCRFVALRCRIWSFSVLASDWL